jgi:hypothetical protein
MFPESINELTVEQYQRYLKVDTENLTFQLLKASEIFLGIPLKVALSAQSDGFFNMMAQLLVRSMVKVGVLGLALNSPSQIKILRVTPVNSCTALLV